MANLPDFRSILNISEGGVYSINFLEHGAGVEAKNSQGQTLLHIVATHRCVLVIELFIGHGATCCSSQ